ncbi:MAG: diguanylate cyclase [Magnetococcales bacterium]|nr:diguanylate cyclase [Magnetococcales bacterium]MBF0322862.1 diguanylate cyclase [Magnetococcales bacterium]
MLREEDDKQWVLVVDADRANRHELSALLKEDCIVALAGRGDQALARVVLDPQPDVILLGLELEDMDGFAILDRLKWDHRTNAIPVLLVVQEENRQEVQRGLDMGAADVVTRPLLPSLVRRRVANLLEVARQRNMLERLVHLDGLTGICNRQHLDAIMAREWERAVRGGTMLSLVLLDVDHFKVFNEQYGFVMGDRVLKAVAKSLQKLLHRPADVAGRFGGGEFGLILPETDHLGAKRMGQEVCRVVADLCIAHTASPTADHVTASVGVATTMPREGALPDMLYQMGRDRLSEAKKAGRNRAAWNEE